MINCTWYKQKTYYLIVIDSLIWLQSNPAFNEKELLSCESTHASSLLHSHWHYVLSSIQVTTEEVTSVSHFCENIKEHKPCYSLNSIWKASLRIWLLTDFIMTHWKRAKHNLNFKNDHPSKEKHTKLKRAIVWCLDAAHNKGNPTSSCTRGCVAECVTAHYKAFCLGYIFGQIGPT